ncbi:kinase-like protein [Pluteus cervinus]|uniref:Kinase-like protein n=1 Tax=Pluteus cervinus TaxID=181527 RepID=A0ACD3BFI4_9AGAR|nr:kinase-like protein [Pluteus cervinus]
MPSHALLLRLFLSPSYFSVHVALRYLSIYADNIGITYYLTRRLKELDTHELFDVWGFICHLLVSRPSKSRALECFVVEIAQRSTHVAMITLWFMQATLKDLSSSRQDNQSFLICQRVLHRCHEIIFGDLPTPVSAPYSALNLAYHGRLFRRKIKPNVEPAILGIGLVLAGVPAMPELTSMMGEVALEQGRADVEGTNIRSVHTHEDRPTGQLPYDGQLASQEQVDQIDGDDDESSPYLLNEIPHRAELIRRHTIDAARTVPALPLHLREIHRSRASQDPLGQLDAEQQPSPYQSSPSIPAAKSPNTNLWDSPEKVLTRYDSGSQMHLLRSYYCRSELQFILGLENICNRLLVVPRPARVSALRAELTALNHKLPAEVCMPMWCPSYDQRKDSQGVPCPHHRIVRIPPSESVVLNSAERAPYVLLIEILNDDLDFDPSRRSNREILKKIILKETQPQKGTFRDFLPFGDSHNPNEPIDIQTSNDVDVGKNKIDMIVEPAVFVDSPTSKEIELPSEEEEVDLVEQLYGVDGVLNAHTVDLTESIVLPPAPKNRELEMAAWSRSSSMPASPMLDGPEPFRTNTQHTISHSHSQPYVGSRMSLDDYSERMRTAAIMLAQLNASLARDSSMISAPQILPDSPAAFARNWLSSSSWLGSSQSNPSTSKSSPQPPGTPSEPSGANRLRLQHSEAAAIRDRIMKEMLTLEEERMERTKENRGGEHLMRLSALSGSMKSAEDESIIRRELSKADPSAIVFSESWASKKSRIRHASPYGHLANWDCVSVIVKTGGDLRQEQLAVQLIHEFQQIWAEEECACWLRYFRILITGGTSGLVETITDAVSIHSIKKAEYARRLAEGRLGHVTLMDHFKNTYGDPTSAKFLRAQRNFAKSLAGYSVITYLLQIKDRHNGNILLDRDGHLIHIDFGFILSNSPGNIGFEAAPFKLPLEYIEVLGGVDGPAFLEFRQLFREGFETARKHCDRIITLVELMQKDSTLPCFAAFGEQTANMLRERFQPALTHSLVGEYVDRLIDTSLGSHWTRLYDSYQYYSQSIL